MSKAIEPDNNGDQEDPGQREDVWNCPYSFVHRALLLPFDPINSTLIPSTPIPSRSNSTQIAQNHTNRGLQPTRCTTISTFGVLSPICAMYWGMDITPSVHSPDQTWSMRSITKDPSWISSHRHARTSLALWAPTLGRG